MAISQDVLVPTEFYSPEFEKIVTDAIDKCNLLLDDRIDKTHLLQTYHAANSEEATILLKHHILSVCELAGYLNHLATDKKFDPIKAPPIVPLTLLKGLQEYSTKAMSEFDRLQNRDKGILEKMNRLKNQVPER